MLHSKKLERCKLVVVNGRLQVKNVVEGLESMMVMWMYQNLTPKGFADLFGEDGRWIGRYQKDHNGIPRFTEADEDWTFEDMYEPRN